MEKSYTIVYQGDIGQGLREKNINNYMVLNDKLVVVYTNEDFDPTILDDIEQVSIWKKAIPMSSLIKIGDGVVNGETVTNASGTSYIENNPYISVDGTGTLIAIIDSGIDYLHPDFINEDGTSKIVSIWDQEGNSNPPPTGAIFGSEFTREDINKAIAENNDNLTKDNIGTGTIAAGIATGNGRLNPLYKGVATKSELIIVKLKHYEGTYMQGRINYLNTDFLAAIKYVCDVSERLNIPTIINLTIGERARSVILTNFLETFDYLESSGVVIVSGAGNEGDTNIHYEGNANTDSPYEDVILEVGEQKNLLITIGANGPGRGSVAVISPSGQLSYKVEYAPDEEAFSGDFNLENSKYTIQIFYPWILSGNEEVEILIEDIKPGIWTLRLFLEFETSGEFDIYLPNGNLIPSNTRFLDPNSFATITLYASTENVRAFNDKTDSMWIGSSKGPLRTKVVLKPDIVAPGVDIISTYINNNYIKSTGTGVSSSLTAGILALMMDYISQQEVYQRKLLFTNVLKTYLMLGATKNSIYTFPNDSQGFGVLNLKDTINAIANKI